MMRRFERMMATPTTKIRLACMRASNESSSMPSPFRAASPHPPLNTFTLHLLRDLLAARYRISSKLVPAHLWHLNLYLPLICLPKVILDLFKDTRRILEKGVSGILRLATSSRDRDCVFEDFDIQSM